MSIWAFWEGRRAAQLEDALREVRMELGRVQLEAARNQVPVRSGGALPESEYAVPDSAAPGSGLSAADILTGNGSFFHEKRNEKRDKRRHERNSAPYVSRW